MDSMIWPIIKMILALGVVCTLFFLLVTVLRRGKGAKGDFTSHETIRLLTTQLIAPRKYIALVEIGGEILALGISEAQITFLAKIENKEFVQKIVEQGSSATEPLSLLRCFQGLPWKPRGIRIGLLGKLHGR